MQLRRATFDDMYEMQNCNLRCLPENYNLRYYCYHYMSWPQLLYVQQDYNRDTAGYVLAKMDDEDDPKKHGHITSLAVLRTHRKLGIASRAMRATQREMDAVFGAQYCSLHVRKTNDAALHLYQDTLGFRCENVEEKYYVDNEDAYHMKNYFKTENTGYYVDANKRLIKQSSNKDTSAAGDGTSTTNKKKNKKGGGAQHTDPNEVERLLAELGELGDGKKGSKGGGNANKQTQQSGKKGKGK